MIRASGSHASPSNCQGNETASTRTATCLSSGCFDVGQNRGVVKALMPSSGVPSAA